MISLEGETLAQEVYVRLQDEVDLLKAKGILPCLALIHTTQNDSSIKHVHLKKTRAEKIGVRLKQFHLIDTTQTELVSLIHRLNKDNSIYGIFVQMPLRDKLNEIEIVSAIAPEKDVDGLTPTSIRNSLLGEKTYLPAGVEATFELLEYYRIKPEGKHWVGLGSSNYLCKPFFQSWFWSW